MLAVQYVKYYYWHISVKTVKHQECMTQQQKQQWQIKHRLHSGNQVTAISKSWLWITDQQKRKAHLSTDDITSCQLRPLKIFVVIVSAGWSAPVCYKIISMAAPPFTTGSAGFSAHLLLDQKSGLPLFGTGSAEWSALFATGHDLGQLVNGALKLIEFTSYIMCDFLSIFTSHTKT